MTSSPARITVRQKDQNYGPYSLHEVNSMLISGRLDHDDLAWIEGTPDWTSLRAVPGVVSVPPLPPRMGHGDQENDYDPDCSDRKILPAFLMAFFVGVFGIHRFYVGKTGSGLAMLLISVTVVGLFITGIWALIDWIMIVSGAFRDADDKLLKEWT
jgi:TM2 domain-containing membrane protein YozV